MGSRYLEDLAEVCRRTGRVVIEVGGAPDATGDHWKRRARSSGGFDSGRPNHVMVHHTASGPGSDGWPDVNYCTFNADARPICNLYVNRAGTIWVCAGGATNTNGSGHDLCGVTPDDSMNTHAIGIEAGNNGTGELWPTDQLDAYNRLCWELCQAYAIPIERIHSHWQYAGYRGKIDPAGPPDYQEPPRDGPHPLSWNMMVFCDEVRASGGVTPPDPPEPPPEDWMANLPTIKKGDSGPYVKRMQHLLASAGFMNEANTANYDGQWGSGTDSAKQRFDVAHGLTPSPPTDCGDRSWESLLTGRHW